MYRFADETGLVVENDTTANITPGNPRLWAQYQQWLAQGNVTAPVDSEQTMVEKLAEISAQRVAMEEADLDYNGMLIKMDQRSWTKLDSTMNKIRRGVATEIEWHCRNGYLILNSDNIDEIELLGVQQIQDAFAWAKAQKQALQEVE